MSAEILIVDDEADIRKLVQGILQDEGYQARLAANAAEAYKHIEAKVPSLVVLDIWLQGSEHDGMQILEKIKQQYPHMPVVMISGHGTIETAVAAIKKGAYDFIEKPFKSDRLLLMIQRALEAAGLRRENEALRKRTEGPVSLVGESPVAQNLLQLIERAAPTNSRILLTGDAGTGKDVAARVVHRLSKRADKPFMVLSCATLHPERLEAELFGTAGEKVGVLEQAHEGTLLLDEVADMPLETQGKIVRVLQEQRFQKVGDDKFIEVDVRILASSNRNLEESIGNGDFRQDLYYRLNVVPIHIPPLKDRRQDIPALVNYFVDALNKNSGLPARNFSTEALAVMQGYDWPGNVRQLRNVVEWVLIMNGATAEQDVHAEHLPPEITGKGIFPGSASGGGESHRSLMDLSLRDAREAFEREYLQSQVSRFGGNISKTAQFVGMERSALHRKLKSLEILAGEKDSNEDESSDAKRKRA